MESVTEVHAFVPAVLTASVVPSVFTHKAAVTSLHLLSVVEVMVFVGSTVRTPEVVHEFFLAVSKAVHAPSVALFCPFAIVRLMVSAVPSVFLH